MKRVAFLFLFAVCLLFSSGADEINLGPFPQGKWLDPQWQAYWVFGDNTIRLLDVRDKEIYNFSGIVQNMRVEEKKTGTLLYFDCALARRSYQFETSPDGKSLKMAISQSGNSVAYKMDMPIISDQELVVYKKKVIEAETAPKTAAVLREMEVAKSLSVILAAASTADFAQLDMLSKESEKKGTLDQLISKLEAEAAKPDAPPSVYVALSIMYGRKGLKTKEYAALAVAEDVGSQPGVSFNVALVYGRKKLLAGSPDAKTFMVGDVYVIPNAPDAQVFIDGVDQGITPMIVNGISAGMHKMKVVAQNYTDIEFQIDVRVGQMERLTPVLVAHSGTLVYTADTPDAVVLVDGTNEYRKSPIHLPIGEHEIIVSEPNRNTHSETIEIIGGETITRAWSLPPEGFLKTAEIHNLISFGLDMNYDKIKAASMFLPQEEKEFLYEKNKTTAMKAFVLNLIIPVVPLGSILQKDIMGSRWSGGLRYGGITAMTLGFYGYYFSVMTSMYSSDSSETNYFAYTGDPVQQVSIAVMAVGAGATVAGFIVGCVRPWVFTPKYNSKLKDAINYDKPTVSVEPLVTFTLDKGETVALLGARISY